MSSLGEAAGGACIGWFPIERVLLERNAGLPLLMLSVFIFINKAYIPRHHGPATVSSCEETNLVAAVLGTACHLGKRGMHL